MSRENESSGRIKRVFRKYAQNRRLWDVNNSKYATLEDVVESVEMGEEVSVIAVHGRGKQKIIGGDLTLETLVDAFRVQQKDRIEAGKGLTVRVEDVMFLMQGRTPHWE